MPTTPYNRAGPGQPIPDYNEWELQHRGTMAPWGVYENPQGETASGFAWPAMITEPIEAGKRFFAPGGGFENNPNPESEKDALTLLMSLYGGNALSGTFKGAALGNALADSGRMGLKDYAKAAYKDWKYADEPAADPRNIEQWKTWAEHDTRARRRMNYSDAVDTMNKTLDEDMSRMDAGLPTVFNDFTDDLKPLTPSDTGYLNALINQRRPEFNVIDGDLLSDTGKPNALGSALAGETTRNRQYRIEAGDPDSVFGPSYQVFSDNAERPIAEFYYNELPNALMVKDARVEPEFRRQGIASAVYGKMQDDMGKPMTPDVTLTPDGYNFWKQNYPNAVKDHSWNGISYQQGMPSQRDNIEWQMQKDGVPEWRTSGGPNRPDGVLWSDQKPSLLGSALASQMGDGSGISLQDLQNFLALR